MEVSVEDLKRQALRLSPHEVFSWACDLLQPDPHTVDEALHGISMTKVAYAEGICRGIFDHDTAASERRWLEMTIKLLRPAWQHDSTLPVWIVRILRDKNRLNTEHLKLINTRLEALITLYSKVSPDTLGHGFDRVLSEALVSR